MAAQQRHYRPFSPLGEVARSSTVRALRTLCKRSHIVDAAPTVIGRIDFLGHRTVDSSVDKIYIDTRLSSKFNFLTR